MLLAFILVAFNETVLVFRPGSEAFNTASEGLVDGLEGEFQIEQLLVVRDKTTVTEMADKIKASKPKLIVLMGVGAIGLYVEYQRNHPLGAEFPPGLIMMSLYARKPIGFLKNVGGIIYEIPGVNSLNQMRTLLQVPIHKVGVLYSLELEDFFQAQKKLCVAEKIELVGLPITPAKKKLKPKEIRNGLTRLIEELEVDAVWVLNDTSLLGKEKDRTNPRILRNGWKRTLKKHDIPVLVGARSLLDLGHIGIFPDHYGMGEQAANLIYHLREEDWKWGEKVVHHPISTVEELGRSFKKPDQQR